MLTTGELAQLLKQGVTGLTSNPTIFEKAISGSTDYDRALAEFVAAGKTPHEAFEALAIEDIQGAADILRAVYDNTAGADGYASIEVPPSLAHDTEATVREARRLFSLIRRPNVMIKVPATAGGVPAVRTLIADGINVNVTLIFALDAYRSVIDAYMSGLEVLIASGKAATRVASVASFFVSRVDTAVDARLRALSGGVGAEAHGDRRCRECADGLRNLQRGVRLGAVRAAARERRARSAPPVGQHQHEGPRPERHALRR